MFFPLSRLRRQLSQRESQVPRAMHYTERCIEVPLFSVRQTGSFKLVFANNLWYGHVFPSQSAAPTALPKGEPSSARNALHRPLALPLGELSPKVTERALQAFLNGDIN